MHEFDPNIDYIKINNYMLSGNFEKANEYIKSLNCNINSVMRIWFDASHVDGLLVNCVYFSNSEFKFQQKYDSIGVSYGGNKYSVPGNVNCALDIDSIHSKISNFMHINHYDRCDILMRSGGNTAHGFGYITYIEMLEDEIGQMTMSFQEIKW